MRRRLVCERLCGWMLAMLIAAPAARGADSDPPETLARLQAELDRAIESRNDVIKSGVPVPEAFASFRRSTGALAHRAVALARSDPGSPDAVKALAWIHTNILYAPETADAFDASYDLMAERYLDSPAITPICELAKQNALATGHAVAFLRAVAGRSPIPEARGLAWYYLGQGLHELARVARALGDPSTRPILERNLGPEVCRMIRSGTQDGYRREAEAAYERTIREYAGQPSPEPGFPPLGKRAEGGLFRLHNLEVGCTPPDLEGIDLDGKPMKLSDYRGKVVVVAFWATWCGPCMGMIPAEKQLVERMKGRPFVLLGVNGDEDRAGAKEAEAREGINWRSFWDRGAGGPIATKWNVKRWPTYYVLDAEGKIRDDGILYFEYLHKKALDKAYEHLVSEAESRAARRRKALDGAR